MRGKGLLYELKQSYPNVKFITSTVDKRTQKSFNYEIRFWYEKSDEADTQVVLDNLFRATKRSVHRHCQPYFSQEKFIALKEIPKKLTTSADNVFSIFEFTLFPNKKIEDKMEVCHIFSELTQKLYEDVFEGRQDIKKTKRG